MDGQQIKVLSKEEALEEAAEEKNEADTKVNLKIYIHAILLQTEPNSFHDQFFIIHN